MGVLDGYNTAAALGHVLMITTTNDTGIWGDFYCVDNNSALNINIETLDHSFVGETARYFINQDASVNNVTFTLDDPTTNLNGVVGGVATFNSGSKFQIELQVIEENHVVILTNESFSVA